MKLLQVYQVQLWEARGRVVRALDCEAEGRWFESHSGQWLDTVKWVPDLIQGRKGSGRRGMGSAYNVSNCGGDPVTQFIVNVYQMIKL